MHYRASQSLISGTLLASLFAAGMAFPQGSHAASESIDSFRNRILDTRVRQLLGTRAKGLRVCLKTQANPVAQSLLAEIDGALLASASGETSKGIESIELFSRTQEFAKRGICRREIRDADNALRSEERKPFSKSIQTFLFASGVLTNGWMNPAALAGPLKLVAELDPWCSTDALPNFKGVLEENPCFAGEGLVFTALHGNGRVIPPSLTSRMERFVSSLHRKVVSAKAGEGIDLWEVYTSLDPSENDSNAPEVRKVFLASLVFLAASTNSIAGYVDGFGDFIWRSELSESGSAESAHAAYLQQKRTRDFYWSVTKAAREKGIIYNVGQADTGDTYRHNIVAAFLGCHYGSLGQKNIALLVPRVAGIAYEAKDFLSHIDEGVSVRKSIKNFRVDTARYRTHSEWGSKFCAP